MTCRDVRSSRVTDVAALALAASKSTSMAVVRKRLSPQCSCTSGRAGLARLQHVDDRRQRLEIQLDLGGQVLCLGAGRRHAHGDELADVAHLARGQDRLHRGLEARQRGVGANRRNALEVLGDEHAVAQPLAECGSP